MLTSLKRIIKNGCKDFSRNLSLSLATIFIMVIVISFPTALFILNPASKILISNIEKKVDISVYFNEDAKKEDILSAKEAIAKLPEVKEVVYLSKEETMEKFVERHKNDPVLMESLAELGENPFLASVNIKAKDLSQYEQITKFLENAPFAKIIKKVDYYERKPIIERIFSVISKINKIGIILAVTAGIIAFLVAFSTIKTSIYSARKEIEIMRLVGASNWFIRGPFFVQGVIVGVISALITFSLTFAFCFLLNSKIQSLFFGVDIFRIFLENMGVLFLTQLGVGIGLGVISSMIAIRKYLKV